MDLVTSTAAFVLRRDRPDAGLKTSAGQRSRTGTHSIADRASGGFEMIGPGFAAGAAAILLRPILIGLAVIAVLLFGGGYLLGILTH